MNRLFKNLLESRRSKAAIRRRTALERARRELELGRTDEGSIWKSGKGGGHHDRI